MVTNQERFEYRPMLIDLTKIETKYINVLSDSDKNNSMIRMLSGFENVSRVDAVTIKGNRILAIAMSHQKALADLSTPGLILEDDCIKYHYRDVIDVPDDADIVFLGIWDMDKPPFSQGVFIPAYKSINDDWVRVYAMTGAHAILYVSELGKKIAMGAYDMAVKTQLWNDIMLSRTLPFIKAYAPKLPLFYQSSMEENTKINYLNYFAPKDDSQRSRHAGADDLNEF